MSRKEKRSRKGKSGSTCSHSLGATGPEFWHWSRQFEIFHLD